MIINKYFYIILASIIILIGITWLTSNNENNNSTILTNRIDSNVNNHEEISSSVSWHDIDYFPTSSPDIKQQSEKPKELSINFINLPQEVKSQESFTIQWEIDGPAGIKGDNTKLELSYEVKSNNQNSSSSSSTKSNQSFGSFITPQTFDSNFKLGGASGTIELKITAQINDQVLTAQDYIKLIE